MNPNEFTERFSMDLNSNNDAIYFKDKITTQNLVKIKINLDREMDYGL
jgi:hypothetical protein